MQYWADATGSTTQAVPKGNGFVQLVYAPSGTTLTPLYWGQSASAWIAANPGWTLGLITPINPVAGRFAGGIVTLSGVAAGANADYVVLGWTGTASSFDEALTQGGAQVGLVTANCVNNLIMAICSRLMGRPISNDAARVTTRNHKRFVSGSELSDFEFVGYPLKVRT